MEVGLGEGVGAAMVAEVEEASLDEVSASNFHLCANRIWITYKPR